MSVIVKLEGDLILYCKGADNVIYERLAADSNLEHRGKLWDNRGVQDLQRVPFGCKTKFRKKFVNFRIELIDTSSILSFMFSRHEKATPPLAIGRTGTRLSVDQVISKFSVWLSGSVYCCSKPSRCDSFLVAIFSKTRAQVEAR